MLLFHDEVYEVHIASPLNFFLLFFLLNQQQIQDSSGIQLETQSTVNDCHYTLEANQGEVKSHGRHFNIIYTASFFSRACQQKKSPNVG